MTIPTITDDLIAEIEAAYMAGWQESGEGWNSEYPCTDEAVEMVMLEAKKMAEGSALVDRLRQLEKDAARWQLRAEVLRQLYSSTLADAELDTAIDNAMQATQ